MFDANMRWLPKGKEFFAEFRGVRVGHPLKQYSENHNVILCEMLSTGRHNPVVRFFLDDSYLDISDKECGCGSWLVYAGCKDGNDFINQDIKREAMSLLEVTK
jgi:hypothetical protein